MDTHALAQHPPSTSRTGRTRARPGPSALAQCFLCSAWAVLLGYGPYSGTSILLKVRPPTGEPDAGDPPVRFGGRGNRDHSVPPTPIHVVPLRGTPNGETSSILSGRTGGLRKGKSTASVRMPSTTEMPRFGCRVMLG